MIRQWGATPGRQRAHYQEPAWSVFSVIGQLGFELTHEGRVVIWYNSRGAANRGNSLRRQGLTVPRALPL
jgi:hypothetical protein